MVTKEKTEPELIAYLFVAMVVLVLLSPYSKQAVEWVLMKFYEFFFQ